MKRNGRALAVGMLLICAWTSAGQNVTVAQVVEHRPWSEILLVVGNKVALSLPDGAYVQGKALAVLPEALELNVDKTSNPDLYPQGENSIPRSQISVMEVWIKRRRDFPIATHVIGSATSPAGIIGIGAIGARIGGYGGLAAHTAVTLGGAIVGVMIGKKLDTEEVATLIRIVSEPSDNLKPSRVHPRSLQSPWRNRTVRETDLPVRTGTPLMPWPR